MTQPLGCIDSCLAAQRPGLRQPFDDHQEFCLGPNEPGGRCGPFGDFVLMALKKLAEGEAPRIGRHGRMKKTAVSGLGSHPCSDAGQNGSERLTRFFRPLTKKSSPLFWNPRARLRLLATDVHPDRMANYEVGSHQKHGPIVSMRRAVFGFKMRGQTSRQNMPLSWALVSGSS